MKKLSSGDKKGENRADETTSTPLQLLMGKHVAEEGGNTVDCREKAIGGKHKEREAWRDTQVPLHRTHNTNQQRARNLSLLPL